MQGFEPSRPLQQSDLLTALERINKACRLCSSPVQNKPVVIWEVWSGKSTGRTEAAAEPLAKLLAGFGSWFTQVLPVPTFSSGRRDHNRKVNPVVNFSPKLMHLLIYSQISLGWSDPARTSPTAMFTKTSLLRHGIFGKAQTIHLSSAPCVADVEEDAVSWPAPR